MDDLLNAYDLIWESKYKTVILGIRNQPPILASESSEIIIEYVELSESKITIRDSEVFGLTSGRCIRLSDFHKEVLTQFNPDVIIDLETIDSKLRKYWVNNLLFKVVTIEEYHNWKSTQRNNTINNIMRH